VRLNGRRGSALMLVPAGFLVMLLLGSIAFDLSLLFLRQRQASSLAADLANDLATLALDEDHLRASGEYVLDPEAAAAIGRDLALRSDLSDRLADLEVAVVDEAEVQVTATVRVEYVFAKAIPGAGEGTEVTATATARAVAG